MFFAAFAAQRSAVKYNECQISLELSIEVLLKQNCVCLALAPSEPKPTKFFHGISTLNKFPQWQKKLFQHPLQLIP